MLSKVLERLADLISRSICEKLGLENIYFISVRLSGDHVEDTTYSIDVNITLEIKPFIGRDITELTYQALEEGIKFAKEEFKKYGIQSRLWRISQ